MSIPVPVLAPPGRYREATAQLSASTCSTTTMPGAVVVLDGAAGWVEQAHTAAAGGARAVVVERPGFSQVDELEGLHRDLKIPVIIERVLCPPALESLTAGSPVAMVAECTAPTSSLPTVLLEAVGLLRLLAGGPPSLDVAASGSGVVAALTGPGDLPITLLGACSGRELRVRVAALGVVRTELAADEVGLRLHQDSTTGRHAFPSLWESPARRALRRARDAVAALTSERDHGEDLGRLIQDTWITDALIGSGTDSL